jgi:lactate dehydrogenase-like 2-hydroxyacid dehydrogenase
MAKPVLLVTRRLPPAVEARAAADFDARLTPSNVPITDIAARAVGADAILTCPGDTFDAALIATLPASVKVIATFSVGYDHVDVASAGARGVAVCNTPDVLSVATAETALLLMLAAARRAGEGERLIRSGHWQGWAPTQLLGIGIVGRRLGIFGMGRIGRELARMARGIGMTIHYVT